MNTAKSFGPAVVSGCTVPNHRAVILLYILIAIGTDLSCSVHQYWLGPFMGSLLGAFFYALLKQYVFSGSVQSLLGDVFDIFSYKYWKLNPDQVTSDPAKSPQFPFIANANPENHDEEKGKTTTVLLRLRSY